MRRKQHKKGHTKNRCKTTAPTKSVDDFPNEILSEIFSYLSCEDLISVKYVCHRWKEVSMNWSLWKNVMYSPKREDTDKKIASILREASCLQTLNLCSRKVTYPVLRSVLDNCKDIRELEFHEHQKLSRAFLQKLLAAYPSLEFLTVPESTLNDMKKVATIGQFSSLRTLIVNHALDSDYVPLILKPIADGCPSLEHIDLGYTFYSISDLKLLLLNKKKKLQTLSVNCCSEEEECCLPYIAQCTALETLSISFVCEADVFGGFEPLNSIETLTSLTFNYLSCADINSMIALFSRTNLKELVELDINEYGNYNDRLCDVIIENCAHLKHLRLTLCRNMTDLSFRNIRSLSNLRSLNLLHADITDTGVEYISKCQRVEWLYFGSCCQLTGRSAGLISGMRSLRVVEFVNCINVDAGSVNKLKGKKNNLVVSFS